MAKKNRQVSEGEPTDADFEAAAADETRDEEPSADTPAAPASVPRRAVAVTEIIVPMLEKEPAYDECIARVDLTLWRTSPEFYTMCRVRLALAQEGQTLRDGRKIDSNADVVRWLLEQLEDGLRPAA